jgi:chemotaxis protein methyltransferase CheR
MNRIESEENPDLTPALFQKFAEIIHREAFINMKDSKLTLLSNRLRKRLRALGMGTYDEYYNYLIHETTGNEMINFIEVVTTNESYFWRSIQNYEMLKRDILPDLLKRFPYETLNFWSAGSSTGEEPYNLAIELIQGMVQNGPFTFKIRASDISKRVVDFARAGRYAGRKIERIPQKVLHRYFMKDLNDPEYYIIRDDIKKKVDFFVENLFEANPGKMHGIFCRNVMIYFSAEDQARLSDHFYEVLRPGGYLVIGHAESLQGMKSRFAVINFPRGIAYQKEPQPGGP